MLLFDVNSDKYVVFCEEKPAIDVTIGSDGQLAVLTTDGTIYCFVVEQSLPHLPNDEDEELAISMLSALPNYSGDPLADLALSLLNDCDFQPQLKRTIDCLKECDVLRRPLITFDALQEIWQLTRSETFSGINSRMSKESTPYEVNYDLNPANRYSEGKAEQSSSHALYVWFWVSVF